MPFSRLHKPYRYEIKNNEKVVRYRHIKLCCERIFRYIPCLYVKAQNVTLLQGMMRHNKLALSAQLSIIRAHWSTKQRIMKSDDDHDRILVLYKLISWERNEAHCISWINPHWYNRIRNKFTYSYNITREFLKQPQQFSCEKRSFVHVQKALSSFIAHLNYNDILKKSVFISPHPVCKYECINVI